MSVIQYLLTEINDCEWFKYNPNIIAIGISPQGFKFCTFVEKYQILLVGNNVCILLEPFMVINFCIALCIMYYVNIVAHCFYYVFTGSMRELSTFVTIFMAHKCSRKALNFAELIINS